MFKVVLPFPGGDDGRVSWSTSVRMAKDIVSGGDSMPSIHLCVCLNGVRYVYAAQDRP